MGRPACILPWSLILTAERLPSDPFVVIGLFIGGMLPFLFAVLFWASFHPLNLGFLGWISLVPLIVYARTTSGKKAFFVAWLAGALTFTACFYWVRYTVPSGPYLLGAYKGLYVAAFVLIVRRMGVGWAPVAWVSLEFIRGYLFSGLPC